MKERREKVVPERANQAGGTARIKQRHVRRVGEQRGVPCGCSRLRKESEWEEMGTGPVWAFVFRLRDEKPLRSLEQRRDVICLVLTGLPMLLSDSGLWGTREEAGGGGAQSRGGRGRYSAYI